VEIKNVPFESLVFMARVMGDYSDCASV